MPFFRATEPDFRRRRALARARPTALADGRRARLGRPEALARARGLRRPASRTSPWRRHGRRVQRRRRVQQARRRRRQHPRRGRPALHRRREHRVLLLRDRGAGPDGPGDPRAGRGADDPGGKRPRGGGRVRDGAEHGCAMQPHRREVADRRGRRRPGSVPRRHHQGGDRLLRPVQEPLRLARRRARPRMRRREGWQDAVRGAPRQTGAAAESRGRRDRRRGGELRVRSPGVPGGAQVPQRLERPRVRPRRQGWRPRG